MPKLNIDDLIQRPEDILELEAQHVDEGGVLVEVKAENPVISAIPFVLRKVSPENCATQGQLISHITQHIPLNEYGFPLFIYRADFLNYTHIMSLLTEKMANSTRLTMLNDAISNAVLQINYEEGFPKGDTGDPIWFKLSYETHDKFQMFIKFLEIGPTRALHKMISWPIAELSEIAATYFWNFRALAYDAFRIVQHEKQRIHRILNAEDDHFSKASVMLERISQAFSKFEDSDFKDAGVTGLVNAMAKLTEVQRLSLGMKDGRPIELARSASTDQLMRRVTTPENPREDAPSLLDDISDATLIEDAQALILRHEGVDMDAVNANVGGSGGESDS